MNARRIGLVLDTSAVAMYATNLDVGETLNEVRDNEAKARESDLVKADQRTIQGTLLPCRKGRAGTHEIRPVVISFDQFRRSLTYAIHIGKHFMTTCV